MKTNLPGGMEGDENGPYQLSAEAAEFVPTLDPANLPKYMFNCYPFVTETGGQQHKNNAAKAAAHQYQSAGPSHNIYSQKSMVPNQLHGPAAPAVRKHHPTLPNGTMYPVASPNMFTHVGGRQPGGIYTQPPHQGIYPPVGYYPHPRCPNPATALPFQNFPHHPAHPPYNNYLPTQPVHHGNTINTPRARPPRTAHHPNSIPSHPHGAQPNGANSNWQGTAQHRKHQRQGSSSDRRPKISVGTQNEFGSKHANNKPASSNTRSITRIITLVDTAAQTDFSSEIADHTLEQMPNALYQGKRKLRRKTMPSRQQNGGADSTDSEELDHSDSGYSSPMHRQNQISSGTDARNKAIEAQFSTPNSLTKLEKAALSTYSITPGLAVVTVSQAGTCSVRQTNSTAVYHTATIHSEHEHLGHIPSHSIGMNGMSYASVLSSKQSAISNSNLQRSQSLPTAGSVLAHSQLSSAQLNDGANSDEEGGPEEASVNIDGKKKKRKRGRRRRRKDKGVMDEDNPQACVVQSTAGHDGFQSPILSQESAFNILAPERMSENFPTFAEAGLYDDSSECKLSGKRKKRREQANKAAMEEQLEIDLEQQALKVVNQTPVMVKPTTTALPLVPSPAASVPISGGRKSQQPVSINIMDFIPKTLQSDTDPLSTALKKSNFSPRATLNPLDSSAPSIKRGKEREIPKAKKPSALKKVILKEREERKRLRYIGEGPVDLISTPDSSLHFTSEPEENDDDDISDMEDPNSLGNSIGDDSGTPHSQDLSPVSQNSPISVGLLSPPTSLSNAASGVGSPTVVSDIIQKIHSRRFREYCKQVLDKEIDVNCTNLLQTLVKFQDRLYHKDPIKAKTKRRLVLGLREVTKHLKLRRVKLVIISPNLEKIQSKGGLDDALNMIINLCSEQDVPFVFALGRRSLGRACAKLVPVSVVGVFNYQGAETMYNELIELTSQAREAYHEMVDALAKELAEYGGALKGSCGLYFSHLGHSRTPSGCSAISFTSSILSEPVSDIACVKPEHITAAYTKPSGSINSEQTSSQSSVPTSASSSVNESRGPLQDDIYDIDEGNEADTEDNDSTNHSPVNQPDAIKLQEETTGEQMSTLNTNNLIETKTYLNNNDMNGEIITSYQEKTLESIDTISQTLTQITLKKRSSHDSHRRSNSGSHIEVRSQTSSRTLDQHDTQSTHSSITIENASETEPVNDPLGSSSSSCKLDRIKSWVRDVDTTNSPAAEISQDDVEFNATYTACEANTDVFISRSRSPSISKS